MGIYGAADSTLVNMSYYAAKANVPLDQTAIFAQRQQNLKDFTSAVSKLFENQYQDHKATEKMRTELAQTAEDILLSGGNVNDFQLDLHNDTVYGFKNELDAIKIDNTLDADGKKRARQKLELKMNKYKNQITEQKAAFEEMVNFSANGLVYTDPGSAESKTWNAILDDYNNGTNNAKQTVENGEIFYTFEGNKMSLKDIKKGLSKHDPEFQNRFQKRINEIVGQFRTLQEQGMEPTVNHMGQMKEILIKEINTLDQVRNLANAKFGNNTHSFEQILMGQAKTSGVNGHEMIDNRGIELIWTELDKLGDDHGWSTSKSKIAAFKSGNSAVDLNNDGKYDAADRKMYKDPANAKLLIEKIKEDKELYKELVVNFTMENAVKEFWAQGEFQRLEAHRLQAIEDARNLKTFKAKEEIKGQQQRKTKGMLTGNQLQEQQQKEMLNTAIDDAVLNSDFSILNNLEKGVRLSGDGKNLYLTKNGSPIKGPKTEEGEETYVTIPITGNEKQLKARIKSYITGFTGDATETLTAEQLYNKYYKK